MAVRRKQRSRVNGRRNRYRFRGGRFFIFLVFLVAIGAIIGSVWVGRIRAKMEQETFYAGISIDGLALGGLTQEQGKNAVQELVNSRLSNIHIELTYMGNAWQFTAKDIGAKADVDTQISAAFLAGREGTWRERNAEIERLGKEGLALKTTVTYDVEKMRDAIESIKAEIDTPARNATVEFAPGTDKMFSYTEAVVGWRLDTETVLDEVKEAIGKKWDVSIELRPMRMEPTVTVEQLKRASKEIVSFSTDLGNSSANRAHNVKKSLLAFDGRVLAPGESISFNETTGERTPENGYKDAPVIGENKQLVDGPGGGVCQSSTTLYNAALLADLKILRRSKHSFPSSYIAKGFDATVNWPNLDLVIENNRELPIFIHTYIYQNRAHVVIYGEPRADGKSIKLESEVYEETEAPAPKIVEDKEAKYVTYVDEKYEQPSRKGYKVRAWQIIYQNGEEVERLLVHEDHYQPIQGTIYVGVTPRPEPTPEPSPTPNPNNNWPTPTPTPTDSQEEPQDPVEQPEG